MEEGGKRQPLSLNQLHNRFLVERSASQSTHKPVPSTFSSSFTTVSIDDFTDTKTNSKLNLPKAPFSIEENEGIPRFDFDYTSPSILEGGGHEESKSGLNGSSPHLFAGIVDFISPSPTHASKSPETNSNPEADDLANIINPIFATRGRECNSNATDTVGEIPIKLKIEGRRRLCKFSMDNVCDVGTSNSFMHGKEPTLDQISDFNSPIKVNNRHASSGNEITDILNDLSSKLEILSIEKKKVPLKKTNPFENFPDLLGSRLYDVSIKEDLIEDRPSEAGSRFDEVDINKAEIQNAHLRERNIAKPVVVNQENIYEISDDEFDGANDSVDDFTIRSKKFTYKLPSQMAKMLFPHQREGLQWLWSLHCRGKGGILGDDMGLGKTMQICSFVAGLFYSNLVKRVLVVAPKTLLTHWANELSVVGLSDKTREYFAPCAKLRHYELQYVLQDKGVLLTTYDIVRNNVNSICGDQHFDNHEEYEATWDYMILDEGHLIKNPSTQRAKSLLQIPCRHRIIISGTPLQNNLKELWALFNFCCPELLGDKKEFKEKYENYINRGSEKNASERDKRIGSSVAKDLRERIQPYFLRRMKSEVFNDSSSLSKKNEIVVWLKLTPCQRQIYEAFLKSELVISACDGSPLAALTILKKICDHPLLLTKRAAEDILEGMDSIVNQEDHLVAEKLAMHIADVAERFDFMEKQDISCKIPFILCLLSDLVPNGHNVLIFSQTRKMLNLIQESLVSNGYQYLRIDGTTKASDRAKIVKSFQEGREAPIFLLTSQVGGLGLTLTNADRVIVVDPAWNPSTDNQSVDRAYRIGQKKDVIVYRLMTCSTVEEKIYRKQVYKGGLFRIATEHKEQTRYFSQQDLRDLFSLPKQGFDISLTQQQLLEEHDRQHTMVESLRAHVEFLETLNIAGVSQHSLLFSKTVPVQEIEVEGEVERLKASTISGNASTRSTSEHNVNGASYAFKPKDAKKLEKKSSPAASEPSETEISDKINRLSFLCANKAVVANLPDKGEKIRKQLTGLNHQLNQLQMNRRNADNIIEL